MIKRLLEKMICSRDYSFIPDEYFDKLASGEIEEFKLEISVRLWENEDGDKCPETQIVYKTTSPLEEGA